ncbi:UDP-N-acetylglucosamine transferase subunit [Dissophora globulifera]|uniref:UDP-N-acetylglucosamine transferase subunit ALG14 n=1 Tax=Dissophora globulifera TaxID=979702 RepID=A0A9P6RC48_9FUNG|nr:UDP-N-acetylglucosamine transferase subunit [Dissophora globulifera]
MDLHHVNRLVLTGVITAALIALPLAFAAAIRLYISLPQNRRRNRAGIAQLSSVSPSTSSSSTARRSELRSRTSVRESHPSSTSTGSSDAHPPAVQRCKTTIFLGSGGHTAEMLQLVSGLDTTKYYPRHYVVGWDDNSSVEKVRRLEAARNQQEITTTGIDQRASTSPLKKQERQEVEEGGYTIRRIPRSRHVHQSMLTTPFTLARSLLVALPLIKRLTCLTKADVHPSSSSSSSPKDDTTIRQRSVLLMNGPGTCFALALAVIGARMLGVPDEQTPDLVFIESFARVKTLSLAGKLLYPLCDVFLVQWPDLAALYPRAQYIGALV